MAPNNEASLPAEACYLTPDDTTSRKGMFTLRALRESLTERQATLGKTAQQVKNMLSALKQIQKFATLSDDHFSDELFGEGFDDLLNKHIMTMTNGGYSRRSVSDRLSLLIKIREHFLELIKNEQTPTSFSDCLRWAMHKQGLRNCDVTRALGIDAATFSHWIRQRGHPSSQFRPVLLQMETLLQLEPGTLISRSGIDFRDSLKGVRNSSAKTDFSERVLEGQRNPYAIIEPSEELRAEWQDLVRHKTSEILRPNEKRHSSWRVKPRHRVSQRLTWAAEVGSPHYLCVTADLAWKFLSNCLGYLSRPDLAGALAISPDKLTLALVSDSERVIACLRFQKERSGTYNSGTYTLVSHIAQMLRPETGYLWQNVHFAAKLPREIQFAMGYDPAMSLVDKEHVWHHWCQSNRTRLYEVYNQLAEQKVIRQSRDPKAPIREILARRRPVTALVEMILKMKAALPSINQPTQRLAFLRDLLLIQLLTANPLRIHNYAILKWRADNSSNLFQTEDGAWRIRFNPEDFKNQKGAAQKPYEVAVSRHLWQEIEYYLKEVRPHLQGALESDFVFRPTKVNSHSRMADKTLPWAIDAMSLRIQSLTRTFIPNSSGFGTHAFRHIIATDFLKNHPGNFMSVAFILHDTLKTVMDEYAHVSTEHGFSHYLSYFDEIIENAI